MKGSRVNQFDSPWGIAIHYPQRDGITAGCSSPGDESGMVASGGSLDPNELNPATGAGFKWWRRRESNSPFFSPDVTHRHAVPHLARFPKRFSPCNTPPTLPYRPQQCQGNAKFCRSIVPRRQGVTGIRQYRYPSRCLCRNHMPRWKQDRQFPHRPRSSGDIHRFRSKQ